ncbi:hypothetical protein ACFYE2_04575 [Kocuria sp. CPCC 205300]|uniref:hypothetical protein n=1 Tax=Kocuria sabuli TaxID=3071448 RepID=UPI0036DADF55
MRTSIKRALAPLAVAGALILPGVSPASAVNHVYDLPAGTACAGFNLRLEVADPGRTEQFLPDKNGLPRSITAGKGNVLKFTNFGTDPGEWVEGESVTIKTGGSVQHTVYNEDGTLTITGTGHNVILLFPGDEPAEETPSTKLYVGKIRYTFDRDTGFTEILSFKGRERDICAELAS